MNSLESQKNYSDRMSNLLEYAIQDTERLKNRLLIKIDINEFEEIICKIKYLVLVNNLLITNIDIHFSVLKINKFSELQTLRFICLKDLKFYLEETEPTQDDAEMYELLKVEMKEKNHEILALWKQCIKIDKLKRTLLNELNEMIDLYNQIMGDWHESVEYFTCGRKTRRLSQSC